MRAKKWYILWLCVDCTRYFFYIKHQSCYITRDLLKSDQKAVAVIIVYNNYKRCLLRCYHHKYYGNNNKFDVINLYNAC